MGVVPGRRPRLRPQKMSTVKKVKRKRQVPKGRIRGEQKQQAVPGKGHTRQIKPPAWACLGPSPTSSESDRERAVLYSPLPATPRTG